jgi:alpha-mannosidase
VGDYVAADVKGIAQRWRVPVLTVQGVEDNHIRGGVSFLEKATSSTAISAVKRHETRDTLIVRLYNLTSSRVEETLMLGSDVSAAWGVNLLEEREGEIAVEGQSVRLTLEPHQIVTVELALTTQPALF